jgi:inorganic triphosphatase YgiF
MNLESADRVDHEREVTLVICSERPEDLADEIAGLSAIRGYSLSPESSEKILDTYLDTADRSLTAIRWALRIRTTLSDHWITLKGPSRPTEWGGLERVEVEALWSRDALNQVLREVDNLKASSEARAETFDLRDPVQTMKSLGFEIIQKRSLQRRGKAVTEQRRGPEIAELAIDAVTYQFPSAYIIHSEVEIEAKSGSIPLAVQELADELIRLYGPELQRWPHSKLATGRAVEELLFAGKLNGLMKGNRLLPRAYPVINELLGS